jgi:hypothetical protein
MNPGIIENHFSPERTGGNNNNALNSSKKAKIIKQQALSHENSPLRDLKG